MSLLQEPKFWVAVSTIIFFIIALKPMRFAINKGISDKISKIRRELDEAEKLKSEAIALLGEAERKLAAVEDQAKAIIKNAESQSNIMLSNSKLKLERDIKIKKDMALQKIKNFEDNAIDEVKKKVSAVTLLAVQTIVEENLDESVLNELADESINKINNKTFH